MRLDRLKYLAREVLPYVEPEKFDMGVWHCNTAACAFGHMAMSKRGKTDGLRISIYGEIEFGGVIDIQAAEEYFEIDSDTSVRLFLDSAEHIAGNDWRSLTAADVASKIESLIAAES